MAGEMAPDIPWKGRLNATTRGGLRPFHATPSHAQTLVLPFQEANTLELRSLSPALKATSAASSSSMTAALAAAIIRTEMREGSKFMVRVTTSFLDFVGLCVASQYSVIWLVLFGVV